MRKETDKIVITGLFMALGVIIPIFFHAAQLGAIFSPMHLTVFACGIIVGWKYGLICGFATPYLSVLLVGQLPLFPTAVSMSLELATYGAIIGLLYQYLKLFKFDVLNAYIALIIAMILGRVVYGIFNAIYFSLIDQYSFEMYISAILLTTWPGIILQLLVVPGLMKVVKPMYEKKWENHSTTYEKN